MSLNRNVKVPRVSAADSVIPGAPGRRSVPVGFGQVAQAAGQFAHFVAMLRRPTATRQTASAASHGRRTSATMRDMAEREELIDTIAGFALFADTPGPRLEAIVHLFEEAAFAEGEKVLRQGLAGSAFYVILDGEAAIVIDGDGARPARPRRVLRRGLGHAR